ncbi:hypothetical protein GGTG_10654 [Gaeumannomyces tritici R3-111a-1]|uniref:Uncharacterized protein n=1 Tax=Gaeumannomyces tritici (strain R3-111a-1) TaxID=644352 RepID=J3PAX9_GAET3|nr:hypothetical protein GGTG_10654 [Gaeumannomyces tritici R3-111a-1]EJT71395.1 hypothetical protein GGTG_10654 [Gaeumannomyces tritici R3-111a-1]
METTRNDAARVKKIQMRREKRERRRKEREATRLANVQSGACETGKEGIEIPKNRAGRSSLANKNDELEKRLAELEKRHAELEKRALRVGARTDKVEAALARRTVEVTTQLEFFKADIKAGREIIRRLSRKVNKMEFWVAQLKGACDVGLDHPKKLTKRERKKKNIAIRNVRRKTEREAREVALRQAAQESRKKDCLAQENRRKAWRDAQKHWKESKMRGFPRRKGAGW